jgi:adenylate cyclase class IV
MDNQKFTLLVTLASSVTVVLISSAANLWSKWIDTKQKQQDRSFEFNKIYAARKIDAGEAAIGKANLIITQVRLQRQLLNAYVTNYGYYHENGPNKIDAEIEKANNLLISDKSSYRLYFDVDDNNERTTQSSLKCDVLLSKIIGRLDTKRGLVESVDEKGVIQVRGENMPSWSKIQKELESLLSEYNSENDIFQKLLLEDCAYFRKELAKYEITS